MENHHKNLNEALRRDDLLRDIINAITIPGQQSRYICGSYISDALAGIAPGGILLACTGNTAQAAGELAAGTGRRPVALKGREGTYTLPGKTREERSISLVPLAAQGIEGHLAGAGFTVNAMAVDLSDVQGQVRLLDPFAGLSDLSDGRLRAVSRLSVSHDPARVMVAAGLCHRYRLEPDQATWLTLKSTAPEVKRLAPGRAFRLLGRLFSGGGLVSRALFLRKLGVLGAMFPELEAVFDVPQNYYHHLGVWEHTVEVLRLLEEFMETPSIAFPAQSGRLASHLEEKLEGGFDRRTYLAIAALLHDIGKPSAMRVEPSGRIRFQGHQLEGARLAVDIGRRLALGHRGRSYLAGLVGQHMAFGFLIKEGESTGDRLRAVAGLGSNCIDVAMLSLADRLATRGEASTREGVELYRRTVRRAVNDYFWLQDSAPLLSGRDVLVHAGVGPGQGVSRLLFRVRVAQKEGIIAGRAGALEYIAPDFKGKMSGG